MVKVLTFCFNPFEENTYVLVNEATSESLIIDPGCLNVTERKELDAALTDTKPVAIINTHGHLDHVFGVNHVAAKYSIPFYLHPADEPLLRNVPNIAWQYGMGEVPSVIPFELLEVGKLHLAGMELEVIHCPGHAPGHVVFYHAAGGWLIGGDVLFKGSVGRTDFPYCSWDDLEHSIRTKLYSLPADTVVYPGHGPATTIGQEKATNPFVRG